MSVDLQTLATIGGGNRLRVETARRNSDGFIADTFLEDVVQFNEDRKILGITGSGMVSAISAPLDLGRCEVSMAVRSLPRSCQRCNSAAESSGAFSPKF